MTEEEHQRNLARNKEYRARPEVQERNKAYRSTCEYKARQRSHQERYRVEGRCVAFRRRKYERSRESVLAYAARYQASYIITVAGQRFNRNTDPPEVIAIAEALKEAKAVIREMRKGDAR